MTTTPRSPIPITPAAARVILNIADEAERHDQQIKAHVRHIVATRQFDLLGEAVTRWLDNPPAEVIAWLNQNAPLPPGTTP